MKVIEVLGPGCSKCRRLEANAREAVVVAGVDAEVRTITDYRQIVARGVISMPGLAIDGRVVASGRVAEVGGIAEWLTEP